MRLYGIFNNKISHPISQAILEDLSGGKSTNQTKHVHTCRKSNILHNSLENQQNSIFSISIKFNFILGFRVQLRVGLFTHSTGCSLFPFLRTSNFSLCSRPCCAFAFLFFSFSALKHQSMFFLASLHVPQNCCGCASQCIFTRTRLNIVAAITQIVLFSPIPLKQESTH